ncbi:metallophosphoesterase family protein [Acidicapsa dinghuensis]|uniref:Metallophosphoesterase family protein n=1 Tax=Acidicapsa dinghuensis TaxID=2218256 RepID=A0ABW1ENL9_9BACT|nr:metallophosphoesterase family protein [Acidicapsa dinghuensis]
MPRIAILSDIHGNLTAFDAVLKDLQITAPDLVLHGGDLADGGSAPAAIVDRIQELGWPGVLGNTDEMLFHPEALETFAAGKPALNALFDVIRRMASATREELGDERLAWLSTLPSTQHIEDVSLLHASPNSVWHAPAPDVEDKILEEAYRPFNSKVIVYGHIHHAFIRMTTTRLYINSGSVGLPYDGDPRASYVLIDGHEAQIRRVEYDLHREIAALRRKGNPACEWIADMLSTARAQMP